MAGGGLRWCSAIALLDRCTFHSADVNSTPFMGPFVGPFSGPFSGRLLRPTWRIHLV